jgi:prepilin-type N-terminal cleavage/methylation domain-containing protein
MPSSDIGTPKQAPLPSFFRLGRQGFTLIELFMVMLLVLVIAFLTIPIGVGFFQTQTLDEASSGVIETLRRAQSQSVFQKNDSAFGVKLLSGSYVLFQGTTYATRTQSEDESFSFATGITTSGIDEVVFSKQNGTPNTTGTITLTIGSNNLIIDINAQGKVERQ